MSPKKFTINPEMQKQFEKLVGMNPEILKRFKKLAKQAEKDKPILDVMMQIKEVLDGSPNIDLQEFAKLYEKELNNARAKKTEGVKSGSYPTKQTKTVIEGLKLYWNDELPIDYYDNGQEFQHDRQTWFNKLADDNGMSFSAIEKIELKYRPTTFIPKSYL